MKLLKTAFRFAPIFSKNLLTSKVGTNKFVLPALVATSYAFMFATQKVLN